MNKKLIFLLILLFALQVSFAQNPIFKETKLFTLDNGEKVLEKNVYENGSWYLITEKSDKKSLIINGKREGWFKKVYGVKFTKDGKSYLVQKELSEEEIDPLNPFKQGKFYVVIDGVKGEEFDYIKEDSFTMTSDGKVVYIASNDGWWNKDRKYVEGKWYVVVNGEKGDEFDFIDKDSLKFTPDEKLAYVASNGGRWNKDKKYFEGKWYVVANGKKKGEGFDYIDKNSLKLTSDGKIVYIASNYGNWKDNKYSGGEYFIIVDKQKSKPYDVFYDFKYLKEKDTLIALAQNGNDILLVEYVNTK